MSIFYHFQHLSLSNDQKEAIEKIKDFIDSETSVFMLKGYAGSGKTIILKGLVEYLGAEKKNFALMAPTGRAAKVIRERTGQEAFTIHKSIYTYDELEEVQVTDEDNGQSFRYHFKISNNTGVANNIFIVDEASMISDAKSQGEFFRFGTDHLLSDLMTYTGVASRTIGAKIIFVGDPCQLPPVGDNSSKAFDADYLEEKFGISIDSAEMKEVKRQGGDSGVLKAATKIRQSISSQFFNDFNLQENGSDILNPTYENFLRTYFNTDNPKIIIASKNKTCLKLNQQIRKHRFGKGNLPIQQGDIVILGANNYRKSVFNGEFAVTNQINPVSISREVTFYPSNKNTKYPKNSNGSITVTLAWRSVELIFPDAESNNKNVSGMVLENFLYGDNYLTPEETQALYVDFKNRYKGLKPRTEEFKEAILNDEYFNCLKIKFGYAVTCHKAQGGEWDNVFTVWDHDNRENFNCFRDPQINAGKSNEYFYRWAYTAVTRASQELFAVNPPRFSSYSTMSVLDASVVNALSELSNSPSQEEEIILNEDLLAKQEQFGLTNQPIQIQDHFLKVHHLLAKNYIEVTGWQRKNMEIFYLCKREGKTCGLKTWVNQQLLFNGKFLSLPAYNNDPAFYTSVEAILKCMPPLSIKRNSTETILKRIEFELELEESHPFLRVLFEDIESLLKSSSIRIEDFQHLQYKERYTFMRQAEQVVLDFEYNAAGFFGRVVPLSYKINSQVLLKDINTQIRILKQESHAC